jgi:Dynamin GTPase effector domain
VPPLQTGLTLTLDGRSMADMIADGPEEDRHLRTIAAHTSAYITHVRRQLKHTLPKAIVHCLVRSPLHQTSLL